MKKLVSIVLIAVFTLVLVGCAANVHKVGSGAQSNIKIEQRQWYVLWGLVPINQVDTAAMAAGSSDYTIKTEQNALDIIINIFTSYVSVVSRTVTVTK